MWEGRTAAIKVHVIPAEVGAHVGLLGAFAIAGFEGDAPGVAYLETPDEGQTTKDSATVAKIILTFDTLRSEALPRGRRHAYGDLRRGRVVALVSPSAGTGVSLVA
jgi:hypothetical protein